MKKKMKENDKDVMQEGGKWIYCGKRGGKRMERQTEGIKTGKQIQTRKRGGNRRR